MEVHLKAKHDDENGFRAEFYIDNAPTHKWEKEEVNPTSALLVVDNTKGTVNFYICLTSTRTKTLFYDVPFEHYRYCVKNADHLRDMITNAIDVEYYGLESK